MNRKKYSLLFSSFLVGSLSLLAHPAYASFPLPPRVSALALASDYTVGQADLMLPVRGNTNQNLYVDPALSYGTDNQNEFDVGVGYRWIANQAAIVGGYLYGGYSRVDNNARLWVVNPGIEALGSRWDAHLNAYFPMGDRHYTAGTRVVPFFVGHSQLARVFLIHQYAGSGADIKAAYQLFPGSSLKGYVGSYYFSPAETNNVWGGAAGLEYWLTQGVKLVGSYTYDKLHQSTYALGLGLEWGGTRVHRADPVLDERLTDPVERNLAELGRGSTIPTRLKVKPLLTLSGGQLTDVVGISSNIAFFSQTGGPNNGGVGLTSANCTFENPCGPTDFSQASVTTLGALLPNTQFYFNGGTYTASTNVTLVSGQSLRSRIADYSQPAIDAARSTLILPTIFLQSNNTVENMILGGSTSVAKVVVQGTNNVIRGSQIGLQGDAVFIGVRNIGDNNLLIDNTTIFAGGVPVGIQTGIFGAQSTNTTVQNSNVTVTSTSAPIAVILVNSGGIITLNNVSVQGTGQQGQVVGLASAISGSRIFATNTAVVVNNSQGTAIGLLADSDSVPQIEFLGGSIDVTGSPAGIIADAGPSTIIDSICTVNGSSVACG